MTDLPALQIPAKPAEFPPDSTRRHAALNERSLQPLEWRALDLAELWRGLCSGEWRFHELFDSDARCYAVLEEVDPQRAIPVADRLVRVLGPLLLGECHKAVASDIGKSPSTVASSAHQALAAMGLARNGSRAPVLLAMAACAALRPRRAPVLARSTRVGTGEHGAILVSMPRPDLEFPARLSPAEAVVIRQLIDGATHAQIAARRGTSPRTVANQLAATFQKLHVSGRASLTAYLIRHAPEFRDDRDEAGELTAH